MPITNAIMKAHAFVQGMYDDGYFPSVCVDEVKKVLVRMCVTIERTQPTDLDALYRSTHAAREEINDLEDFLAEHDSGIETAAREVMAADFEIIAKAYGFDADIEELADRHARMLGAARASVAMVRPRPSFARTCCYAIATR